MNTHDLKKLIDKSRVSLSRDVKCRNAQTVDKKSNKRTASSTGTRLIQLSENQANVDSSLEGEVEKTVVKRLDAIKNKDEGTVRALMDEHYSKFDDWPPFKRQEAAEALENEFSAFKVLTEYTYELKDFGVNVLGDVAVATFHMHYHGLIRNRPFDVNSRVTSVLRRHDSGWKVVHEHFSRFPDETRQQYMPPRRSMQP